MKLTLTILILFLTPFISSGQRRPEPDHKITPEEIADSTLINYTWQDILLIRYLPTQGEWGGTTDSILIFRTNDCPDSTIGVRTLHCKTLKASLTSIERIFGYDTIITTEGSRVKLDSVEIEGPIHSLINQAIEELYNGAKEFHNGEWGPSSGMYFEISMGFYYEGGRYSNFKFESRQAKNKWESFEKLKKIITLTNNT